MIIIIISIFHTFCFHDPHAGSPMVHPMPEIKAVVGRSVHIICPASGYPLDKIFWSKGSLKASHWLVG